jgi:hypothetical protein
VGRATLATHAFSPDVLAQLERVFDDVWTELAPRINDINRDRVSVAITGALIALARVGQRDRDRLWAYALSQATAALAKL